MKLPFHTYDVFTSERFGGNPLAIVEEADGLTTAEMQVISREFNLSETIFVMKPRDPARSVPAELGAKLINSAIFFLVSGGS